jgi:GMP synthase (glutamine-hydrolysing)
MKPVLILQNLHQDGPAYLGSWLSRRGLRQVVCNSDSGHDFPDSIDGFGGLALLGGDMGANDALPSLRQAEVLIRQAMQRGVPTIGHCLGGQLMARALGARVFVADRPEIGWHPIRMVDTVATRHWFGNVDAHTVFQWHYDAFDVPVGAVSLAHSAVCANQAFAIGPHLAMQFHVELDGDKLRQWTEQDDVRFGAATGHTVHTAAEMRRQGDVLLHVQQRLADRIYGQWWRQVEEAHRPPAPAFH